MLRIRVVLAAFIMVAESARWNFGRVFRPAYAVSRICIHVGWMPSTSGGLSLIAGQGFAEHAEEALLVRWHIYRRNQRSHRHGPRGRR